MKHIFIMNPVAGVQSSYNYINQEIDKYINDYDIIKYNTKRTNDATVFIKDYLEKNPDEEVRFYACGGDGTLNEVMTGVIGHSNASIGLFPCGSGDDFVKVVGGKTKYRNIKALLDSKNRPIDIIKVGDKYSINVVNYGFEANVCNSANEAKGKSKNPYLTGLLQNIPGGLKNYIYVYDDDELLNPNGTLLLASFANGGYVGGKYNCAPKAKIDDGLMELTMIKCTPLLTFINLIGVYEKGKHLEDKRFEKILTYRQVKKAKLKSSTGKQFYLCLDGEIVKGTEFDVEILEHAVNFGFVE